MDALDGRRLAWLSAACIVIGLVMAFGAKAILWLIAVVTNLAFYHRLSSLAITPAGQSLGYWVVLVPAVGGLFVGLLARYGSRAIQGHGIPEAMEQVLFNGSRVPAKVLLLKPLSTCLVIGTGGPFGAEGVVIATGGALGSLLGQILPASPIERKTLLAAGAAAGLSATFACPISAVLLAVELLLFEFHARSLIPVALASASAAAMRIVLLGPGPMFNIPALPAPGAWSLGGYLILGAVVGLVAVAVVELVHRVEHFFEKLPIHWMWKPALGGLAIGLLGLMEPRAFGPGYAEIQGLLSGQISSMAGWLGAVKLCAWIVGVGSATASGTLAPLLLIGSSAGTLISQALGGLLDPRVAALAGMAAFFGGMSGAFLASVILAFEATYEPTVLMPILASAAAAYLVCKLLSRENIMTQKFIRQGFAVPAGLTASPLDWMHVAEAVSNGAPTVSMTAELGATGRVVSEDATLREAARRMIELETDELAVLSCTEADKIVGLLKQRDILAAFKNEEGVDHSRLSKLSFLQRKIHVSPSPKVL